MHTLCTNTHLSPGVHCFVPPVAEPSPATDTGVPLLVFSIGGREIDGIGPSLEIQTSEQVTREAEKRAVIEADTRFLNSPLSLWALPQSFHPHTSHPPTPSCWRAAGSCPEVGAADL